MFCGGRVRVLCVSALLCVAAGDELQRRLDSLTRRLHRWDTSPRRHHHRQPRPSVAEPPPPPLNFSLTPTTPPPSQHDNEQQVEQLLRDLMAGYQSDQPRSPFQLKQQLASQAGVARLRQLGPERAFRSEPPDDQDTTLQAAMKHMKDIYLSNYTCSAPAGRLLRVADVYPSASVQYVPAVVLLNRCSDDTGCCMHEVQTCAASATRTVHFAFMVINFGVTSARTLKFTEDVSCHCVTRSSLRRPWCPSGEVLNDVSSEVALSGRHGLHHGSHHSKQNSQKKCNCPGEFVSRPYPNGRCKCDCFDGNKKCTRIKRGKTYLPEDQNRCVIRGSCDPPDCSYGTYMKRRGRCPRKHEKNRSWLNYTV